MKSLKIEASEKKENAHPSIVADSPQYPYGLKLHFDEMTYKKLELGEVPKVGDKFMVLAYAEVCDVHQNKYEGDQPQISMGMQIMDIELKKKEMEKQRDIASELYGSKE